MDMAKFSRKVVMLLLMVFLPALLTKSYAQDLESAILLTKSEQFDAADRAFKSLIQQNPKSGEYYFYYGDNYLKRYFADTSTVSFKDMTDSARIIFERGTLVDPGSPFCYAGLAEVALLKKDVTTAQANFDKVALLLPSKKNKAIELEPSKHSMVLVKMADAYVKANVIDTGKVFPLLREAEKLDPKNYELYIVRGDVYFRFLNDGSSAKANYNMAQVLNPTSPMAKLREGQLWIRAKQYQLALNAYQDLVKIDSNFAPAYRELGFLLSKANRNTDAKRNFEKFLYLSAGNLAAQLQYVNTLLDLQEYQQAIAQINQILASDTSNNDLNRALAYSYFETEQYDKALIYAEKFLARAPADKVRPSDLSYYGRILVKNKMDAKAAQVLLDAYKLDTTKPELISEAAMCYVRQKDYPKAIETYNMKVTLNAATPMDYYNLGKTYYNLQDFKMADSMLAIFNQQQPTYVQGFVWRARASSKLDPDSKLGTAKPVYESILEKTAADTAKYQKERIEALYYLTFFYFQIYSDTKSKEDGIRAMEFGERIVAIDPNDENAVKAKQIIDILKKNIK